MMFLIEMMFYLEVGYVEFYVDVILWFFYFYIFLFIIVDYKENFYGFILFFNYFKNFIC